MSKSNASAKQRRAFVSPPVQSQPNAISQPQQSTPSNSTSGLTLQQVISLFDRRIVNLESFMKESTQKVKFQEDTSTESSVDNLPEIIDEFNSRFELFAQEIGTIKDALLKLQTYTMEVNKTLLEERTQLLSLDANVSSEPADVVVEEEQPLQLTDPIVSNESEPNADADTDTRSTGVSASNFRKRGKP
jgi:hypothetical protein